VNGGRSQFQPPPAPTQLSPQPNVMLAYSDHGWFNDIQNEAQSAQS
jgi:hypothetical protein